MVFKDKTIGQLVAEDYSKAEVFKKYGIDFCCGGGRTVKDVCEKKGVDYAVLEKELLNAGRKNSGGDSLNANEWQLDFLADFIMNVHHAYVRITFRICWNMPKSWRRCMAAPTPKR